MAELFHHDCRMSKLAGTTQPQLLILQMRKPRPREGTSFVPGHAISRVRVLALHCASPRVPVHIRCPLGAHQHVLLMDEQAGWGTLLGPEV